MATRTANRRQPTRVRKGRRYPRPPRRGRQVLYGVHPWKAQLWQARTLTPSQWLAARRRLLKGYSVAFTTKHGDLAYDCDTCGFHIRNGSDPDVDGFWADVAEHEQEHRDREEAAS